MNHEDHEEHEGKRVEVLSQRNEATNRHHPDFVFFVVFVVQRLDSSFVTPPMNGTNAFGTVTDPSAFW